MLGHLTTHKLYKVHFEDAITNLLTIFQRAIMANTSKCAANLLVWYRHFAHLNKIFIKNLDKITSRIVVTPFNNKLSFCNICVKAKMTTEPY